MRSTRERREKTFESPASVNLNSKSDGTGTRPSTLSNVYSVLWIAVLFGTLAFFLVTSLLPGPTHSKVERRRLASMPKLSFQGMESGRYQADLEGYLDDHLFGRDALLRFNALASTTLYGALDQNGFVLKDGHIIKVERRINEQSLAYAASLFERIWKDNLEGTDCRVYFSIIPDKSYFLEKDAYLNMDYQAFFEEARHIFDFGTEIPIADTLALEDYYCTDPHWRQEAIVEQAELIAQTMGAAIPGPFTEETVLDSFTAQQGLQSLYRHSADALKVLRSASMENWTVTRYDEKGKHEGELYGPVQSKSDPYAVFLGGSAGMIEIENPDSPSNRELVIFGDSYASSIAPLLASGYAKTTIVDLRNLPSYRLSSMIEFSDQDVLFLYSTTILNQAKALK